MMAGLPHYFTLLLNKLIMEYDVEVALVKPAQRSASVGSGVHEDSSGRRFRLYELEEYRTWYGKPFFRNLEETLLAEQPDALVVSWPYILHFAMSTPFYTWCRKQGIRLIVRDIPFNIPTWGKIGAYYFGGKNLNEDFSSTTSWLGYARFLAVTLARRVYLRRADALIFYTEEAYDIIGSYGVSREKIFITANSPDTDELLAANEQVSQEEPILPPNPYRLIHVGRLVKWKRVDLIIEAVCQLQANYPAIELVVVGYGPEEAIIKQQVIDAGIVERVRFVGGVYDPVSLGRYLHVSAVYVLAGMGGLSINDAMCFGKPVICSVADGTERRLVRSGYNGYYFENGNIDSLTEKIGVLLSDPQRVRQFGENSLKIIREEVNIHNVLREYVQAFEYAIQKNHSITA